MQHTHMLTIGLVTIFTALSVSADTTDHLFKLTPTTGGTPFVFGNAVGVSGTIGIVGSTGESTNGSFSGAAYLYDLTTGQELFTLHPSDADDFDVFGFSVAIDNQIAIIGAPQNDDAGDNSGSAYLFDVATGQQQFKLTPSDNQFGDNFGFSVAIDAGLAVIGAPEDSDNGNFSGSAYIFNAVTGQQLFKLLPDDGQFSDNFGMSVAISGNIVIVGSWHDDDLGNGSGSAYLFDATTGLQITKIIPSDGEGGDEFARFVAIDGSTALISATGVAGGAGSAYLFDVSTPASPVQLFKLEPDSGVQMSFGWGLDLNETTAIIGAFGDSNAAMTAATGSAYLIDTTTGSMLCRYLAIDGLSGDRFGISVAITQTTLLIGAGSDDGINGVVGSAYIYNAAAPCPADLTGDGNLNFADISAFLLAFGNQDPIADFFPDGLFNFFDVSEYLIAYGAGCP